MQRLNSLWVFPKPWKFRSDPGVPGGLATCTLTLTLSAKTLLGWLLVPENSAFLFLYCRQYDLQYLRCVQHVLSHQSAVNVLSVSRVVITVYVCQYIFHFMEFYI